MYFSPKHDKIFTYCALNTCPFFWAITIVTNTFSGRRIGARKCRTNATRRCSIATIFLEWTLSTLHFGILWWNPRTWWWVNTWLRYLHNLFGLWSLHNSTIFKISLLKFYLHDSLHSIQSTAFHVVLPQTVLLLARLTYGPLSSPTIYVAPGHRTNLLQYFSQ